MGLDPQRARHAINIAGVASAALRQSRVGELSHWKGVAFANAARQGVFAAMLAREGMTGPSPIFEGDMGFEKLVSGPLPVKGPFADDATATPMDDEGPMILRTSIKCWPVEYHAQSAVEAALALRAELAASDVIDEVLVESHDAAVDIIGSEPAKWAPATRETADHSLPYITAVALADGEVTTRQFDPGRIAEPKLREFIRRVKVERHAELSAIYPGAVGNLVTLKLRGGRTLSRRVDYPCGHARNRMRDAGVEEKFHRLVDPVLGRERAEAVAQCVRRLDELATPGELTRLLELPAVRA
jgi:2-methylcitrate dehydratase